MKTDNNGNRGLRETVQVQALLAELDRLCDMRRVLRLTASDFMGLRDTKAAFARYAVWRLRRQVPQLDHKQLQTS